MGSRSIVTACLLGVLACAPGAGAASWDGARALPGTEGRVPVAAAYGPSGLRVAVGGPFALFPGSPQVPIALSDPSVPSGPVALPSGLAAPLATSAGGTMLAVGGPRSPVDYFSLEGNRARVRVAIGPIGEALRAVSTRGLVATKTLAAAVNDAGDAAVVVSRCRAKSVECRDRELLAIFRRRSGSFSKALVLAGRTDDASASVALNARGDAVVAWTRRADNGDTPATVGARVRRANGTLTKIRTAGTTARRPTIATTLTDARRASIAWFSQVTGEGSTGGAYTVSHTEIDSRGTMSARNVLDRGATTTSEGGAILGARLRMVMGPRGVPVLAWTGVADGRRVVRAGTVIRDVDAIQQLSPSSTDAQLLDLGSNATGTAVVLWGTHPATAAAAAVRPAGSAQFGPSQLVFAGADASFTGAVAVAPDGGANVVGGPEVVLNRQAPPPVMLNTLPAG